MTISNSAKIIHPYINKRIQQLQKYLYPRNHLWGIDIFNLSKTREFNLIPNWNLPTPVCRAFKKIFFSQFSPGINVEIPSLICSFRNSLIYSVCGPLSLVRAYGKAKVFAWVFSPPKREIRNPLHPYHPSNLKRYTGFLCLTPDAEKYFAHFAPSKFIPWCIDLKMFDGKPSLNQTQSPYFFASGKTARDYKTLVESAYTTKANIRIVGPRDQKPLLIPDNVNWIETSTDPPDQAIDYPTLKKWYEQCSGICIPLSGDANDTCGYTNMLEGMAMAKPVLMTRSGCLHIDPKSRNFGMLIEPQDSQGWSDSMNRIIDDKVFANSCGEKGRKIVENEFTIERFNNDIASFISEVLKNS